jgi:hypothetical protein
MKTPWIRPAVGAAVLITMALAGCGNTPVAKAAPPAPATSPAPAPTAPESTPASAPASTPATTGHTPESPPGQCSAAGFRIATYGGDGAAGSAYTGIALTNASKHSCTLSGVPGVRFTDAAGKALPTAAKSSGDPASRFTVKPGGKAYFTIRTANVEDDNEGAPCNPEAAGLEVTLPGGTSHVRLAGRFHACQQGAVEVFPLTAKPDPYLHD